MNKILNCKLIAAALIIGSAAFAFQSAAEKTERTVHESIFDYKSPDLGTSHFTWGADVGASIDVNGYDMSTFDFDIVIGYKNEVLKTFGLSAGIHRDIYQGTTFVPLEVVCRTSFVSRPVPVFFNFKAGYSFNTVGDSPTTGGFIFNSGIGFNLYRSRRMQTHLLLSYQYVHLDEQQGVMIDKKRSHADMIQIGFGINF